MDISPFAVILMALWLIVSGRTILHELIHSFAKASYGLRPAVEIPIGAALRRSGLHLVTRNMEFHATWLGLLLDGNGITRPWPYHSEQAPRAMDIVIPISAPVGMMIIGASIAALAGLLHVHDEIIKQTVVAVGFGWALDGLVNAVPLGPGMIRTGGVPVADAVRGNDGYAALRSAWRLSIVLAFVPLVVLLGILGIAAMAVCVTVAIHTC